MTKSKARNKSEKEALFVCGTAVTGVTATTGSIRVTEPLDHYYVGNICPAHPVSGHVAIYDKDGKPLKAFPQAYNINLRNRICQDCGSMYFEIGQDDS